MRGFIYNKFKGMIFERFLVPLPALNLEFSH